MRKYLEPLILFSIFILLLSCNSSTTKENNSLHKNHKGFIIDGILAKGKAKYIYLLDKENVKIDSARIKKHSFSLIGNIKTPEKYYLQLNNSNKKHPIILENSNYKMLLNKNKAMITGGKLNTIFDEYKTKQSDFSHQKSNFLELFSKRNLDLRPYLKSVDSIRKIEKKLFTNFILDNKNNILSSILLDQVTLSSKQATKLQKKLEVSNIKNNLYRKLGVIIKKIKIAEKAEKIQRRKPVPLFSGVNLDGRQTHLEKIINGKKAFLIDFWASWCPPCRELSPKIKVLYEKYNSKGFDVLTVSEDRSVDEWKNGVFLDDMEDWHHIYDDFNRISSMFNVGPLPHMVLIDENGKIIKNNISLSDLETKLEKIFNENE